MDTEQKPPADEGRLERGVGRPVPTRCTGGVKCSEDARYDEVSHGVYSLTLKCRLCGAIVRHDWD